MRSVWPKRAARPAMPALVLALSACAGWPPANPRMADVAVPQAVGWQHGTAATGATVGAVGATGLPATEPALAAGPASLGPGAGWWAMLREPLLDELVAQALKAAPDLRTAEARVRESRARRDAASAARGPVITAGPAVSRSRSSGSTGAGRSSTLIDVGFDASWELDLFGRLQAAADASGLDAAAAEANLRGVRTTLAGDVTRAYASLRSLQVRQVVARDSLARQADTLQITRWRAQAGLVSTLDVVQAEASLAQTQAQLAVLVGNEASSLLQLEGLLGAAPGAWSQRLALPAGPSASALPSLPADQALSAPADVLRQRPDIRAAEAQWRAEVARSRQAQAAQFPKLALGGNLGLQALTLGSLGQGGYGALAASLVAPIFDGGALRAQLAAQVAVQDRAAIAYESTMLTALSEVEAALAALDSGRRQSAALAQAVAASRQAAALGRLRYRSGLVDFRTVLDAERSVLGNEDSLVTAQATTLTAWAQLHKALGGSWPEGETPNQSQAPTEAKAETRADTRATAGTGPAPAPGTAAALRAADTP